MLAAPCIVPSCPCLTHTSLEGEDHQQHPQLCQFCSRHPLWVLSVSW